MFIRISGQFAQILDLWMSNYGIEDPVLRTRVARVLEKETIPVEAWRGLLERAAALSPHTAVGLQIGGGVQLRHLGLLGYLIANCDTLVDALNTYQLCERRFYSVNFARLERTGDDYRLFWPDRLGEKNALFVQVALAVLVRFLRHRFPVSFQLTAVRLTGPKPLDIRPFSDYFRCAVSFDSNLPGITVAYQAAAAMEPGKLPSDYSAIQRQQNAAFDQVLEVKNEFLRQLQTVLLKMIPENRVSLPGVATAMECSPRTLQRRLGEYGYSYQSLLDAVREQLGWRYLQNAELTFFEIAMLLGFSEQSSFNRAFRLWTGATPGEMRQRERARGFVHLGSE